MLDVSPAGYPQEEMAEPKIVIRRVHDEHRRAKPKDTTNLGFGRYISDHFFATEFDRENGWRLIRIEPMRPLAIDAAAICLHYGQEVFEGLKAYRGKDDGIYLFRWQENARRLKRSCERLMMDCVPESLFGRAIKSLVLLDRDWIPDDPDCALYIRPTLLATDPCLGVRPGDEYAFYVILSPVGAYYPEGFAPISIWVSEEDVRAVRGGLGEAKTAANYAHSLCAQQKAQKLGYSQVLWLDALEHRWVEEVGTSNIFFRINDEVITPPLGGTILPGVTRDCVIKVCERWGIDVKQRNISIQEVVECAKTGDLKEVFGTGTAAVISPIGVLCHRDQDVVVNGNQVGELTQRLYDYLTRLQRGYEEDVFGWVERIDGLSLEELTNPNGI